MTQGELLAPASETDQLRQQLLQAQRLSSVGALASSVAHEFNNILMAILGYTSLVLDDVPPGGPVWSNVQQVLMAGERARDLVQQILAFSRQVKVEHIPTKLHVLVQEAPDWIVAHLNVRDDHRSITPDMVERALRELFSEPIRLDVRLTKELERGRTGKLRCIVSRVGRVA